VSPRPYWRGYLKLSLGMGRLTLNVLLSFAQFEREVIGERVRDKIAASKRKGIWVGGPVPLGYRCIGKKLVVVPEEAETVRTIFRRYLELGSLGALMTDLDRSCIRTKAVLRLDGSVRGGIRFGVGALAHLLKNRFYIGEVVYRGEVHQGEHEPILDRDLFDAVQARLAANGVARTLRLRGAAGILAGRLFDDRGNRMSPTHSNKLGVRYRYYVSRALLQDQGHEAGSVPRVPAPEIEQLVVDGIRAHLSLPELPADVTERDLIERHVARVTITSTAVEVRLMGKVSAADSPDEVAPEEPASTLLTLAWTAPSFAAVKGIVHEPVAKPTMKPENRHALLAAIAKARQWIDDVRLGRTTTLAEIADREGVGERYIRLLAPLAFVAPRLVAAIADGTAPADLTVTGLAKSVPYGWEGQESKCLPVVVRHEL
jgi:site-specific DNA recombinase